MANFLIVLPSAGHEATAKQLFREGLFLAKELKAQRPNSVVEGDFAFVASFARANGGGAKVVADTKTGRWLFASGTWFHEAGFTSGEEPRLLERLNQIEAPALARELEGFFVIAAGDALHRDITVITDLMGSCHCFVRAFDHAIAISGSSLLLAAMGEATVDRVAAQEYLATGIIYEHRTLYREVEKLGPATAYRYHNGTLQEKRRYWHIRDVCPDSLPGAQAIEAIGESLKTAARRIAGRFPRTVCDLTGGYDSRGLISGFLASGVKFSTTVSGAPASPDVEISRGLAQLKNLPHLHQNPEPITGFDDVLRAVAVTDGEYDSVEYARVYEIHRRLAGVYDISINGSYGEVGRGYWWELLFPKTGARIPLDCARIARLRFAANSHDGSIFDPTQRLNLSEHFRGVIERSNEGLEAYPNTTQLDHAYLSLRMQRWQGRIASSTDQIWPCLSPFMMRSVLEPMLRASPSDRRRSLLMRRLITALAPEVAAYPLEHGYPAMALSFRNFYRFYPLFAQYGGKVIRKLGKRFRAAPPALPSEASMVRQRLWREDRVRELLSAQSLRSASVLDADGVRNFLRRSADASFPFGDQWARLLSIECALQRQAFGRARVGSHFKTVRIHPVVS